MSHPSPSSSASVKPGRSQIFIIILLLIVGVAAGALILRGGSSDAKAVSQGNQEAAKPGTKDDHGHDAHAEKGAEGAEGAERSEHAEGAVPKGANGGQLFTEGTFALELLLVEAGGEPRFQAWLYDNDKPLSPTGTQVTVTLSRPNGEEQKIVLQPKAASLTSAATVAEPHIFDATITVQTPTEPYLFTFSRDEGVVTMNDTQIAAAGITLDTSAPATLRSALQFPGEIKFNDDRTAHIVPRANGVVESVSANLGQQVKKGQVLAVISSASVSETRAELQAAQRRRELAQTTYEREKNLWEQKISPEQDVLQARQALREAEITVANATQKLRTLGTSASSGSLGRLELRAPFDGMVVEKHIALGEAVKEDTTVFTLSDLSSVWTELKIAARDLEQVRVGGQVLVRAGASDATATGTIAYVGSFIGEQTRTAPARVVLANPQGAWRPGLFVTVEVLADEKVSPVTVASSALQTLDDKSVVFLKVPGGFAPQPVQTGRSDGKRVEIVSGLKPGATYAASGSFVIKSEQGKSSATHAH